jgi:hypothetical protein
MKRDDADIPDNMYITNNYTHATRVRVEIMKAIVKKCANEEERMFLNQFCNRPIIRITNTKTKHERIWTFTDLLESYRHRLNDSDLETAYRRAGFKFIGQMKQLFGVLKERKDTNQDRREQQRQDNKETQAEPPTKKPQLLQAPRKWTKNQDNKDKKTINKMK